LVPKVATSITHQQNTRLQHNHLVFGLSLNLISLSVRDRVHFYRFLNGYGLVCIDNNTDDINHSFIACKSNGLSRPRSVDDNDKFINAVLMGSYCETRGFFRYGLLQFGEKRTNSDGWC